MKNFLNGVLHICVFVVFFHTYSALAMSVEPKKEKTEIVKKNIEIDLRDSSDELEKIALKKMSANQATEYLIAKSAITKNLPVEIIVPLAFFAVPPICLFLFSIFRFRTIREKQQTLRVMVENGAHIPPEMFMDGKKTVEPKERDRKRGILLCLGSIAFIIFTFAIRETPEGAWSIGLIPLFLGIGYLINSKMTESSADKE